MFFNFNKASSQLKKYDFDNYDFSSQQTIDAAKEDVLSVANILLEESIKNNKKTRLNAGYFLSDWMSNTDAYTFGTGNLRDLLDDKKELAMISMAAQIKHCLENNSNNSYNPDSMLRIWEIIASYIQDPKNKVKLSDNQKKLIRAKNDNRLAEFLEENE